MAENNEFVTIYGDSPEEFIKLDNKKIPGFLKHLAEETIRRVSNEPEIALDCAYRIYKRLTNTQPEEHADAMKLWFMAFARQAFEVYEKEVNGIVNKESTTEEIRRAFGISGYVGYLFIHGLVDINTVEHWIMNVLQGDINKIIRLNLMEIVKIPMKAFSEDDDDDDDDQDSKSMEKLKILVETIRKEIGFDEENVKVVQYRKRLVINQS